MKLLKKLFNTQEAPLVLTPKFVKESGSPVTVTVAEIHNAFDIAGEELLIDAKNYLANIDQGEIDKSKRLSKLGFNNNQVKRAIPQIQGKNQNKETADLVTYYTETYRFLKFLTEDKLTEICERYGLIFAPVKHYLEEVPEQNITEIENAQKLKPLDIIQNHKTLKVTRFWDVMTPELKAFLSQEQPLPVDFKTKFNPTEGEIEKFVLANGFTKDDWNGYLFHDAEIKEVKKEGLFICAPPSHFDLKGLSHQGGVAFLEETITKIDDPIVFRYVKGGCQVLSKWGEEASDPDLQLPINN